MSENNDNSSESNSMSSDTLLQPSRITGNITGISSTLVRTGVLRPSLLGPSRLGSALSNNSIIRLTTSDSVAEDEVKENPFLRDQDDNKEEEASEASTTPATDTKSKDEENCDNNDDLADPMSMLRKNGFERANLFAAAKNSIPMVEKSGFVFGQNVHERVVGENVKPECSSKTESNQPVGSDKRELLFSNVIQNAVAAAAKPTGENNGVAIKESTETKSLTDVAREYEESRARKRTFEEVETFTGEENEVNILDINCKLFAFVKSNWEERGRGGLRLNDSKNEQECSRLVFRTAGNLRVLLNTKVWGDMDAARPSQKSLRLTALDNSGKIKIFLVMARPAEISQLYNALKERIDKWKLLHPDESSGATGGIATDDDNGTNDKDNNKSGITKHEVEEAASALEPDHDDSSEPSPKKSIAYNADGSTPDNSNN